MCQAFEITIHTEGVSITAADTPTEKLKDIIDHYYKTQIDDPRIDDKHTAHRLIEDELVIETGDNKGVRVTLHELSILVKFAQRGANEADEKIRLKHLLDALGKLISSKTISACKLGNAELKASALSKLPIL